MQADIPEEVVAVAEDLGVEAISITKKGAKWIDLELRAVGTNVFFNFMGGSFYLGVVTPIRRRVLTCRA